ncbi:ABC transporter ATP-binding protein [soil metagenome]|jgi:branched-chain amino acid transport system ATP-binding protein
MTVPPTEVVLEVTGLHASYGRIVALRGVDLRVAAGELVALVGGNGAGKTTLLRVLSGLVRPTAGRVAFNGRDVTGMRTDELVGLGMVHVPEGRQVLGRMTIQENLRMGAYRRRDRQGVLDDLDAVYARFPLLAERRAQAAGTLSGGEQQQLVIGRALMARPSLLLLDEPSLGLAPLLVTQIFDLVVQLRSEGLTILLVEQNARQALTRADRAYVQETGRFVLEGPAAELADDERLQQAYLGGHARGAPRPGLGG